MLTSGRVLQVFLILFLVGTFVVTLRGPFDQLGWDLGVVVALAASVAMPILAAVRLAEMRRTSQARRRSPFDYVLALYTQLVLGGVVLLAVPLIVMLVRGIWIPHCDLGGGLIWYLLIPGITTLYTAALGLLFALLTRRVATALLGSYIFIFLTFAIALRHVIWDPPIFFFQGVIGYFPGPIYDEAIPVTGAVLWARLGTLFWTGLFVAVSAATCDLRRQKIDPVQFLELDYSFENLTPRLTAVVCVIGLVVLHTTRHQNGTVPNAASIQKELGGRVETDHFVIYYDADALDTDQVSLLVEDHEFRLAQIMGFLGWREIPGDEPLTSYVYPSAEVKKRLMGAAGTSFADPINRAMHVNQAGFPHPVLKHEMMHIVSASFAGPLGFNPRIGLHEGLAVAADWEDERLTPDQWSAVMKSEGLLPDLRTLTSSVRFWAQPASRAYLSAGSFVRYLFREFGPERFIAFFRDSNYQQHFGRSFEDLAAAWEAGLDTVRVSSADSAFATTRLKQKTIFDRRCPRQAAEISDLAWSDYRQGRYLAALDGFDHLLAWSPDDTNPRLGRLYALLRLGRTEEAIAHGRALIADGASSVQVVDSVRNILGDLAWKAGDLDEARREFEAIIASGAVHALVRGAQARLAVLGNEAYRRVLADEDVGTTEAATILTTLGESGPEPALADYLLGRRLYQENSWSAAAGALYAAVEPSLVGGARGRRGAGSGDEGRGDPVALPDTSLVAEGLWLLGEARYRMGDHEGAEAAFHLIVGLHRNAAEIHLAMSWIDRCRWRRGEDLAPVRYTDWASAPGEWW